MGDAAIHALAGAAGGCVSMAVTYPLVNLSTRAAVQSKQEDLPLHHALQKILQKEGVAGLYSGLGSSLLGIAATNGIYYACYEKTRSTLLRRQGRRSSSSSAALSTGEGIVAGLIAGSITSILTNPIWTVQTAQSTQSVVSADGQAVKEKDTMLEATRRIYKSSGVRGFWRGIGPALVLVINPVIQYTTSERILALVLALRQAKSGITATRSSLSDWDFFMLGAVSKLIATGSTYPIIVVKSRLDQQAATHRYHSLLRAILEILQKEGIKGLYAGLLPKLLQSVLTAAFMFAAQRRIYELIKRAMLLRPRLA